MDLPTKFRISLLLAKLTLKDFAKLHSVSHTYIHLCLAEKTTVSPRIRKAIDEFVNSQMLILRSNLNNEAA